jgi:hypothetical protein
MSTKSAANMSTKSAANMSTKSVASADREAASAAVNREAASAAAFSLSLDHSQLGRLLIETGALLKPKEGKKWAKIASLDQDLTMAKECEGGVDLDTFLSSQPAPIVLVAIQEDRKVRKNLLGMSKKPLVSFTIETSTTQVSQTYITVVPLTYEISYMKCMAACSRIVLRIPTLAQIIFIRLMHSVCSWGPCVFLYVELRNYASLVFDQLHCHPFPNPFHSKKDHSI